MEFDLESVRRDWIVGISGAEFAAKVVSSADILEKQTGGQRARGVLLAASDPIKFAADFFATQLTRTPVVLGNPQWGEREWAQLYRLVRPVAAFGEVGVPPLGGLVSEDRLKAGLQPGSILIPTGGTTGGVKLAIHNWSSLCEASYGLQAFLGGGPIHSCCVLPLYHVSGLMQLVRSLVTGGRIRFDDADLSGYCLSLVPTQLQRALQDSNSARKLSEASVIFVGGAPMSEELAERARSLKLPIVPVYGMTETAAMCAAVPTADFLSDPSAGAVPIGDTRFQIEDDGKIRIQSGALFSGYQGHEPMDLSSGYLTGDFGHIDNDGRLHVEGRADRVIISGGEKMDPQEVEQAIGELAGVDAVLAVGLPDAEWGQKLVVFYTGVEIQDWKAELAARLANYKIPKRMIHVDELPLDAKGKLNKTVGASLVKTAEDSASGTL